MTTPSRELTLIASGAQMLAEARDLMEVRQVRDLAVAATAYARARDLGEDAVRSAQRIVILATRRLGEELLAGQARGEVATNRDGGRPTKSVDAADTFTPVGPSTLSDLGISRDLSSVAKVLALAPEAVDAYLASDPEPSMAGALRAVNARIRVGNAPTDLPLTDVHRAKFPEVAIADERVAINEAMYAFGRPGKFEADEWAARVLAMPADYQANVRSHIAYVGRWAAKWESALAPQPLHAVGGTAE